MKQKTKFKQTEIGKIPEDWEVKKIRELVDIKHGFAFKGEYFSEEPNEHILLTPGNFNVGGGFKSSKFKYYTGNYPKSYILQEGEIIVSMTDLSKTGDTLGYPAKTPKSKNKFFLHNQRLGLIQFKSKEINPDFFYWLLRTHNYQRSIVNSSSGSTVKHTSPDRIKDYVFIMPKKIHEQKAIAKILSDLDAKIELNIRMNNALESIGQNLFRKWFIDLEEIQKGWATKSLDKIADFLNGLALQKYPVKGEEFLPVIKIRELKQGITTNTDKADVNIPAEYVVNDGDILFSWSGSLEVVIWGQGKGALNQHLFKVSSEDYPKWFYYYWTKHHLPEFKHIAAGKATTMGHIKRHHLEEAKCIVPDKKSLNNMTKVFEPIIERQIKNLVEIRKLSGIRDLLLPKLMSGEIRVKN